VEEFDLECKDLLVVFAAFVGAVVTTFAAVELGVWCTCSDFQRRGNRRDGVGLGHHHEDGALDSARTADRTMSKLALRS
jgi:hypothetical protein